MLVKLSKPFTPPGEGATPIAELELKVEDLTGAHVLKATREADSKRGGPAASIAIDVVFHIEIAALASGFEAEVLSRLPAKDFIAVQTAVQGFLLDVG